MAKILFPDVPAYTSEWTITNIAANPKRPGSDAHADYEILEEGMTVADHALALHHKKPRPEISWNFQRGFISLTDPDGVVYGAAAEDEEDADEEMSSESHEMENQE